MGLFREQVATDRTAALHGTINLAMPIGWSVITIALGSMVAIAAAFVASASYTRAEVAAGSISPSGGIQEVVAPRTGRVSDQRL